EVVNESRSGTRQSSESAENLKSGDFSYERFTSSPRKGAIVERTDAGSIGYGRRRHGRGV
ncbi:MAG: hypothetical protein L0Z53_28435, partial [Acidobacteriales bacterium]|nr:hypothetical protein [Terriglobales bacterium]